MRYLCCWECVRVIVGVVYDDGGGVVDVVLVLSLVLSVLLVVSLVVVVIVVVVRMVTMVCCSGCQWWRCLCRRC